MNVTVTYHPPSDYRGRITDQVAGSPADGPVRAEGLQPGDFILVHSYGRLAPRLIGFGQRLHHDPGYAYWTHAALYVGEVSTPREVTDRYDRWTFAHLPEPTPQPTLIEAKGGSPVRYVPLAQYDARDYAAVRFHLPSVTMNLGQGTTDAVPMRDNAVKYAQSRLGQGYGYLTILTLAAWTLFGGRVTLGLSGDDVCSGLVAKATMYLGAIYDQDPAVLEPADLARIYGVRR